MLNKIRMWVASKMGWRVIEYHSTKEDVKRVNSMIKSNCNGVSLKKEL